MLRRASTTIDGRRTALARIGRRCPFPLLEAGEIELLAWRAVLAVGDGAVRSYVGHARQFYGWAGRPRVHRRQPGRGPSGAGKGPAAAPPDLHRRPGNSPVVGAAPDPAVAGAGRLGRPARQGDRLPAAGEHPADPAPAGGPGGHRRHQGQQGADCAAVLIRSGRGRRRGPAAARLVLHPPRWPARPEPARPGVRPGRRLPAQVGVAATLHMLRHWFGTTRTACTRICGSSRS